MDASERSENKTLFHSLYKDVWRKMIPAGLTEAEADFIEEIAKLHASSKVLDIMCGYGRHSIELAGRGHEVTAIDYLADYIQEIETVANNQNLKVNARVEDVSQSSGFGGPFDAAVCMGNCISYLDAEKCLQVLKKIAASLKPGAVFIIDTWMIAEIAVRHFDARTWLQVDEYKYLLDNRFLFQPTRIETDHIVISNSGEVQVLRDTDYVFSFSEFQEMLNEAGFLMTEIYATPRKKKYSFGDKKAYIVAEKK
jgi:2-polyprenyl-3-methyl-5-hydroxy-6-metoxy-1,4-benzoquinol methylase